LADTTPFRTEQLRLDTGERFVLTVSADGMPVWWPNLYCSIGLRERGVGFSTMLGCMSSICVFHNVCSRLRIDVTARIESLELFTEEAPSGTRTGKTGWSPSTTTSSGAPTQSSIEYRCETSAYRKPDSG
jgi:hypothetical protein